MEEDQENQWKQIKNDDQRLSGVAGDEKLLIKLKIPKVQNDGGGVGNNQSRVCPECNKEFSCGKALGGHMRVHVQGNKDHIDPNHSVKLKNINIDTTCKLCGKDFPSMKSLFGHMRCHPDRGYRGIQPPPSAMNNSASSSVIDAPKINDQVDSPAVDLMQPFPRWSVTARRGRKAIGSNSGDEDDQLRDAVDDLMLLYDALTQKQPVELTKSDSPKKAAEIEDANGVSESKKRRIEVLPPDYPESTDVGGLSMIMNKGKEKESGNKSDTDLTDDESDSRNNIDLVVNYKYSEISNGKMVSMKKKIKTKKMKLMMDLESEKDAPLVTTTTSTPEKYRCSTCNKCFPTHQALGGHRSSHNKFKITIINAIDEPSSTPAKVDRPVIIKESEGAATYQCNICDKTFPTGQALGGHKRCHWTSPTEVAPPPPPPTEASQTERTILDFDLNELPPLEEDDQGVIESEHGAAAGYGNVSSGNSNVGYS